MAKKANTKADTIEPTIKKSVLKSPALPWAIITIALSVAVGFAIGWHTNHNMSQAIESRANQVAELKADKIVSDLKSQEQ